MSQRVLPFIGSSYSRKHWLQYAAVCRGFGAPAPAMNVALLRLGQREISGWLGAVPKDRKIGRGSLLTTTAGRLQ